MRTLEYQTVRCLSAAIVAQLFWTFLCQELGENVTFGDSDWVFLGVPNVKRGKMELHFSHLKEKHLHYVMHYIHITPFFSYVLFTFLWIGTISGHVSSLTTLVTFKHLSTSWNSRIVAWTSPRVICSETSYPFIEHIDLCTTL